MKNSTDIKLMGMFTGYYESSTKNALECAHESLHTRSLKNKSSDIV